MIKFQKQYLILIMNKEIIFVKNAQIKNLIVMMKSINIILKNITTIILKEISLYQIINPKNFILIKNLII